MPCGHHNIFKWQDTETCPCLYHTFSQRTGCFVDVTLLSDLPQESNMSREMSLDLGKSCVDGFEHIFYVFEKRLVAYHTGFQRRGSWTMLCWRPRVVKSHDTKTCLSGITHFEITVHFRVLGPRFILPGFQSHGVAQNRRAWKWPRIFENHVVMVACMFLVYLMYIRSF